MYEHTLLLKYKKKSYGLFGDFTVESLIDFQSLDTWWKAKSLGFTPYRVIRSAWLEGKDKR